MKAEGSDVFTCREIVVMIIYMDWEDLCHHSQFFILHDYNSRVVFS